jgi:hypothetical protein
MRQKSRSAISEASDFGRDGMENVLPSRSFFLLFAQVTKGWVLREFKSRAKILMEVKNDEGAKLVGGI